MSEFSDSAEGRTTRWTYDRQGRGLTRTLPMGQSESFQYDSNGQRVQHTTFNGEAIATAYDNLGRPTTVTLPGKTRTFSYDAGNRVTSIQEGADTYSFQYDVRDRLIRATDAQNRSIDYAYDAIGNRTRLSTSRQQVDYTYDELNRLTEVIAILDQGRAQTTSYAYDGVGNRAGQTHPNGTTVAYTYDERNRLKTLLHKASAAANAAILLSLSYSVDASGLRTQIAETRPNPTASQPAITRTTDYQYDAVKRLTREQVTGTQSQARTSVFTYDKVGNRKTEATSGTLSKNQTLTYDNNDRLTRVAGTGGTIDHVYDNAGNLIEKKQGTATLERYTFDAEGRLTAATIGTGASQKVLSYRYDPNGIRRSQHVETATGQARTEYLVDPNQAYAQVLEEYETQAATGQALPASTLATTYVYGDDLISQTQLALAGNTTHVYHYDGLGTTRALSAHNLDAQGNPVTRGPNAHATITDRYSYLAFGENDPAGSSGNTTGSTDNNYRYTGEQLDPNLGFYYLRARYMDPRSGRFVGMDPFDGRSGEPMTLHKYLYANVDPTNGIDPSGRMTVFGVGAFTMINTTIRVVMLGMKAIDGVDAVVTWVSIGIAVRDVANGLLMSGIDRATIAKDQKYAEALANYGEAAFVLSANMHRIGSYLLREKHGRDKMLEFIKNPKNNLLIYGPTPETNSPIYAIYPPSLRVQIGSIGLSKGSRKIFLEAGKGKSGSGGRFIGTGHTFGNTKDHKQWWRMDWHKEHGSEDWIYPSPPKEPRYHFHTKSA